MSSTLVPPPGTEREPPRDPPASSPRISADRRRIDVYRRALRWGMLASLLIHVVAVVVVSRLLYLDATGLSRQPRLVRLPEGIEVVEVPVPPSVEPVTEPDRPVLRPGEQRVIQVVPGGPADEREVVELRRLTNAERLIPQISDERLWFPYPDEPFPERIAGAYARADSAVRALVREWLDSLALSEEERRRATEWTFGEGDEKWGISEKGLHLGDITIPIPFGALFGESPSPNARKAREMVRQFNEIRQQDVDTDIRKQREEALKEMRKRTEEEVERRQRDTTDAAPADSAGG